MTDSAGPSALVEHRRDGDVLVLTIKNPPVNAFSPGVPEGLHAGLDLAEREEGIRAVVIIGGGRTFIAGADIRTFNLPRAQAPDLRGFVSRLDQYPKPTVAAIHGTALGGGLEVALACNYRVAVPDAQLGLPEVKLGVLPGAGGTQRLTRLVGAPRALDMMLSGQPVSAQEAHSLGLVDELATGDLRSHAVAFARAHADARPLPRVSERQVAGASMELFMQARQNLKKTHPGQLSPRYIVDLAEIASTKAFADGWAAEARLFMQAKDSPQSRGLRHMFFAEREAARVPGLSKDTPTSEIRRVGVVGAGTMGTGIAMNFLNVGLPVVLVEQTGDALERGLVNLRRTYERAVQKGRLSAEELEKRLALLSVSLQLEDLSQTDLIIEAVFEDMAVKRDLFVGLDRVAGPDAILATNTSTLDVDEIAAVTSRPQQVIGLHFFSPAHVMKLLEIVRGAKTSDRVLATAVALARRIGKVGVVVGVCNGFVGNRMLYPYREQAGRLVLEGARPEEIDAAMTDFGLAMGPFAMSDLAGLDIGYAARRARAAAQGQPLPDDWLDRVVEAGRKGQKTQAGVYDYPAGRTPVPSPAVEKLLQDYRHEKGIQRREVSREEATKRLLYTLANEGARILEEGVAQRASDIDVVYVYGYGFPAYRGGPMHYASEQGLADVVADLERYGMEPAPLLRQLAQQGKTFADWDRERTSPNAGS